MHVESSCLDAGERGGGREEFGVTLAVNAKMAAEATIFDGALLSRTRASKGAAAAAACGSREGADQP